MRRLLLYTAAALFFAYEQWSFYTWMQQHGTVSAGLAHAWMTLRQDPMVFMAWNDMGIFTAIVLTWFWRELRQSGRSMIWWVATLLTGCPPLLVYLGMYTHPEPSTHDARP